jgi:lycopene cyclase domain-containing protein
MPELGRYSHLFYLVAFNLVMLAILWARNWRWLRLQWRTLLAVAAAAVLWMVVTDPIGGAWGAWFFDPGKVLGIWLFGRMPLEDLIGITLVSLSAASAVLVFGYSPRRFI